MLVVLLVSVLISRLCSVKQASAVGSEDCCWVHQGQGRIKGQYCFYESIV